MVALAAATGGCWSHKTQVYTGPPPAEPGDPEKDTGAGGPYWIPPPKILSVTFTVPGTEPCSARVTLLNVDNRPVRRIIDSVYAPGDYDIVWNKLDSAGRTIDEGWYYYHYEVCDSVWNKVLKYRRRIGR